MNIVVGAMFFEIVQKSLYLELRPLFKWNLIIYIEYTNVDAILYFWEGVAATLVSRSSSPVSSYLLSLAQPVSQPGWAEPDSQREKREVWSVE